MQENRDDIPALKSQPEYSTEEIIFDAVWKQRRFRKYKLLLLLCLVGTLTSMALTYYVIR